MSLKTWWRQLKSACWWTRWPEVINNENKIKLLYISQHYPPEAQAAAFRAHETAVGLAEHDVEVHVLTAFPNLKAFRHQSKYRRKLFVQEHESSVVVTRVFVPLDTKNSSLIRIINYLCFMVLASIAGIFLPKPDIIITTTPPLFVAVPGMFIAWLKGAKYVLEIRDLWLDFAIMLGQLKNWLIINTSRLVEKLALKQADEIIVVTNGYKDYLIDRGIAESKLKVIHAGVDFSNPVFEKVTPNITLSKKYNIEGSFIAGFAGNIGLAQGLDVVVEAARILRTISNVKFVLLGDGVEKDRLEKKASQYGLYNILFIGFLPRVEAAELIRCFDCCLVTLIDMPLFQITLPSKLFESMAFGKPVLLGLTGEAEQILKEANAGVTFDVAKPHALADAVMYMNQNQEVARQMGGNGYLFAKAHFDRAIMIKKLKDLLTELI